MMMQLTIGIIGSGAMGTGIAQIAAQAGHKVLVYDTREEALKISKSKLESTFERLVEKQKMSGERAAEILNNISFKANLRQFDKCSLVIEAIVERLDAKKSVFNLLEEVVPQDCILASNTSSLSIASISAGMKHPERVLGIHFFNPAPLMPLVEIIPGLRSASAFVEKAESLVKSWGKTTVLAKDTPGFIVNRVARPFYSEAIKMVEEGVADMTTIDWAMRELGGFKMGPFELMDLIGHDVNYVVTETVWTQFFYDPRFRPSITQKRLLEAGLLGRKSGRGFYDYSTGATIPEPDKDLKKGQDILNRILVLLINEAADAVFQNIASQADIDLAMKLGVNYPKGLLAWANEMGIETVLTSLTVLQEYYGDDRYRACPILRKMAAEGRRFEV
jgi:3-hydroxybutyryl-CoA dehydrogenase